jgi:hypothetical protein
MQEDVETNHPWFHTVAHLSAAGLTQVPSRRPVRAEYRHDDAYRRCAIKVLERQGKTVATIAWSDSTACCYGEQLWRRCVARKSGICALSGRAIVAGDAVYRPRLVEPAPRNIEAMILATVMEAIPSEDAVERDSVA